VKPGGGPVWKSEVAGYRSEQCLASSDWAVARGEEDSRYG